MTASTLDIVRTRYTTKHYDPAKDISPEDWAAVEEILRLAPSSVNYQPVEYFVATTREEKERVAKGILDFNKERTVLASRVVVFAVPLEATEAHFRSVLEKETADGRYAGVKGEGVPDAGRRHFVGLHQVTPAELVGWFTRQAYLACGFVTIATAAMGIDSTIMEGADFAAIDRELGLREKGLTAVLAMSFGYRAENDSNASRPKSRLALDAVVHHL